MTSVTPPPPPVDPSAVDLSAQNSVDVPLGNAPMEVSPEDKQKVSRKRSSSDSAHPRSRKARNKVERVGAHAKKDDSISTSSIDSDTFAASDVDMTENSSPMARESSSMADDSSTMVKSKTSSRSRGRSKTSRSQADTTNEITTQVTAAAIATTLEVAATQTTKKRSTKKSHTNSTVKPDDKKLAVLEIVGLVKNFGTTIAVDHISLRVEEGTFYGIVGPNGAGKTTTLSMITGLLRPTAGVVRVNGSDVWADTVKAKQRMGVLPDRLRLFDRLTGTQFLYYAGILRGLDEEITRHRVTDLADVFGLENAMNRLVGDYSAGMKKKIALAAAMIHSPKLLVLDEPFESIDPVSVRHVIEILHRFTKSGGTVVLSSHGMDLIQRVCDSVAIVVHGKILAQGAVSEVCGEQSLEQRFVELAGGRAETEGMEWLHSFSE